MAARVVQIRRETHRAATLRLAVPGAPPHRAGQHCVVRLSAPDGYVAMRSYSVASAPDGSGEIELTVERLEDGEVSGYLVDELGVGDEIDVRGPLGGFFVWDGATPAIAIGGGSGVVPLMSMLRLARATGRSDLIRLLVSVRTPEELLFASELPGPEATVVYTRAVPAGFLRQPGRVTRDDLGPLVGDGVGADTTVFICGSGGFADAVGRTLIDLGVPTGQIRVERFGPTAG